MTDETTTEQLAEIDRDMADIERQVAELVEEAQQADYKTQELPAEYTPPEGWRVLAVGEALREGDVTVRKDGYCYSTERVGSLVGANQRYIRPIESQAEPEPPDGWQLVPLGEPLKGGDEYDAKLDRYIRRLEPQPQPQPEPQSQPPVPQDADQMIRLLSEANHNHVAMIGRLQGRINDLETIRDNQAATIEELRSEVSYVQNLLGTERRRVAELEELASSLRTINVAQEKAFDAAGQDNTALRNQLEAVKAEVVQERLERNRWHNQVLRVTAELDEKTAQCEILQIELDAAQQVPADSPELRQLWADLEQATRERDQYLDSYQRIFGDLETIRETTKAETVEAIAEWLEPIRLADSAYLANATMQHLPSIMRHLTGLNDEEIE